MSDFDELAERAERDFDLGDFARAVRACRSFRRFDEGIAAQTILLAAAQAGFGGCMLHAFNHSVVEAALGLEAEARERNLAQLKPLMVIALGRPAETVRLEPLEASPDGSTNYWRDDTSVHHVPKRSLEDVLL